MLSHALTPATVKHTTSAPSTVFIILSNKAFFGIFSLASCPGERCAGETAMSALIFYCGDFWGCEAGSVCARAAASSFAFLLAM
jgi:hypothetical protein